jgi:hypothetical protein
MWCGPEYDTSCELCLGIIDVISCTTHNFIWWQLSYKFYMYSSEYHNFMYFFGAEVGFALLILFINIHFSVYLKQKILCAQKGSLW